MAYAVSVEHAGLKALEALPQRERIRIVARLETLGDDPRPPGAKKLRASDNLWRVRVGVYRISYRIHVHQLVVVVVKIAHRRESYRGR